MRPHADAARPGPALVLAAFAATLALALALGGCGDDAPAARTIEIVVPAGTQKRLDAGEKVVVMPARLELRVGDSLKIRNDDSVEQSVGPYVVGAGEQVVFEYGKAGVYEGYCPLTDGERYYIVVT